ncbi:hypothetical protein WME94_19975 [Sorangium sp. So ce429]
MNDNAEPMNPHAKMEALRDALRDLPPGASSRQRGEAHLALGAALAALGSGHALEAAEELRQAIEVLPERDAALAHARARFELGRLLVLHPLSGHTLEDATYHLERAHATFDREESGGERAEAAIALATALAGLGKAERAVALLEQERRRAPPSHRPRTEISLAIHCLLDPSLRPHGEALLEACFARGEPALRDRDLGVEDLFGWAAQALSPGLVRGALRWFEASADPPSGLLTVLRARLDPKRPEAWLTPAERDALAAQMDGPLPVGARCNAAYQLVWCLRAPEDRELRLRAVQFLHEQIDASGFAPEMTLVARNDLAAAMLELSDGIPALLATAEVHLERVLDATGPGEIRTAAARNLVRARLRVLEQKAKISIRDLTEHAPRIEALVPDLAPAAAASTRLEAARQLLRYGALSQPGCVQAAGALIDRVLEWDPEHPDAARMRFRHAWIQREQGTGSEAQVKGAEARARSLGAALELAVEPPSGMSEAELRALARVLAGTSAPDEIDPRFLEDVVWIRPDAADLLIEAAKRTIARAGAAGREARVLLDRAFRAAMAASGRDERSRGRRLAELLLACEASMPRADLLLARRMLRGPVRDELDAALRSAGWNGLEVPESGPEAEDAGATALHRRGIELLDRARRARAESPASARADAEAALRVLDQARAASRSMAPGQRAIIQISAGNARRVLADVAAGGAVPLLREAEALYREALPWTEPRSLERALLEKVLADALIAQGDPGFWDEAMRLYARALEVRSGWQRAETLVGVAGAELAGPRERAANERAALQRLEEALACLEPGTRDDIRRKACELMCGLLASVARSQPGAEDFLRMAAVIAEADPASRDKARLAAEGLSPDAFTAATPEQRRFLASEMAAAAMPAVYAAIGEAQRGAAELRALAEQLGRSGAEESAERRAGRLWGRAAVLKRLRDLGEETRASLVVALEAAESAIEEVADPELRLLASGELAALWQHDEGGDFARSARLLERVLSAAPRAPSALRADALMRLARAKRYRPDLPRGEAIRCALELYREAERIYRDIGNAFGVATTLRNQAEALSTLQDRPEANALREAIAMARRAAEIAGAIEDSDLLGAILSNLAWDHVLLARATGLSADERERALAEAGRLFDRADPLLRDPRERRAFENNRLNWRSAVAPESDLVGTWREQLARADGQSQPQAWSMAAHNLAEQLLRVGAERAEVREALELYRGALALRPVEREPRFHWETAQELGHLLGRLYEAACRDRSALAPLGLDAASARAQAIEALRSAMRAARTMGPGTMLVRSAGILGRLAAVTLPGQAPDLALAQEALSAVQEVLALAPDDADAGRTEASIATAVAGSLADARAATGAVQSVTLTGAAALHGAAAWEVLHWVLRARGGQHRRLRSRMRRPEEVAAETWTRWRLALRRTENWDERRAAAAAVRAEAGAFLEPEPDLSATFAWMEATGGAAATLLRSPRGWLLGVLVRDEGGKVQPCVVLLEASSFPLRTNEVVSRLSTTHPEGGTGALDPRATAGAAAETLDALLTWFGGAILPDLRARIPLGTRALLWSPHGQVATFPLGLAWDDVPSVWTTSCLSLPPPSGPLRPSAALLVLADPVPLGDSRAIPEAPEAFAQIAQTLAARLHRVEALAACGRLVGAAAVGDLEVPGLVTDAWPSPAEVCRRLPEHNVVVVIAHAAHDPERPERSQILLLGESGPAALEAGRLAESADLLRGAAVFLLSCEAGAAGELSAAPVGMAGVLLAAGAAVVMAPLWPVLAGVALGIGESVLRSVAEGVELGFALRVAIERARESSGELAQSSYMWGPFVVWAG